MLLSCTLEPTDWLSVQLGSLLSKMIAAMALMLLALPVLLRLRAGARANPDSNPDPDPDPNPNQVPANALSSTTALLDDRHHVLHTSTPPSGRAPHGHDSDTTRRRSPPGPAPGA